MKYALLIYAEPRYAKVLSEAERDAVTGEFTALMSDSRLVDGAQLQPVETATTVRVQDGRIGGSVEVRPVVER